MVRALVLIAALGCGRSNFNVRGDGGSGAGDAVGDGITADTRGGDAPTAMVVAGATSGTSAVTANALAWMHTSGAADIALIVFVGTRSNGGGPPVMSMLYGTASMTKVVALCAACGGGGNNDNYEIWYLPSPPPGSATIQVFLSGMATGASGLAMSYSGTAGTMLDTTANTYATSSTATLSWTTGATAQWAVAGTMVQGGTPAMLVATTGQVERDSVVCDTGAWEGQTSADQLAVSGAQNVSWTWMIDAGSGPNCTSMLTSSQWIALGASFK